jgi:hypothetical protein
VSPVRFWGAAFIPEKVLFTGKSSPLHKYGFVLCESHQQSGLTLLYIFQRPGPVRIIAFAAFNGRNKTASTKGLLYMKCEDQEFIFGNLIFLEASPGIAHFMAEIDEKTGYGDGCIEEYRLNFDLVDNCLIYPDSGQFGQGQTFPDVGMIWEFLGGKTIAVE